jgi:phosphoribosyl 1,2-cyclic phosphate phosphodiesterase
VKITFLGTCAAEGYPALWCRCERCTVARQRGGRNLRLRSSALINDDLFIDPGPDTVASTVRLGVDLAPVQAMLITHPHTDHLDPSTFSWRRKGFVATALPWLHMYASQASFAKMGRTEGPGVDAESLRLRAHPIHALESFDVRTGAELLPDTRFDDGAQDVPQTPPRRYRVWSFPARHATPDVEPMIYAIEQTEGPEIAGRGAPVSVLYATDTGPFLDETWAALDDLGKTHGLRLSAAIVDSTNGAGKDSTAHMSISQMSWHQAELERRGLLAPGARKIGHHFSHNGTPPYEELTELLQPHGIVSSYDGMVVDL